ncbi:MAG: cryptochrome/photolyase family protein [Candidatus Cyclobacteriaceae bacterium M3_2C_046]
MLFQEYFDISNNIITKTLFLQTLLKQHFMSQIMNKTTIFWFRRDLRIEDNVALYHALQSPFPVQPVFIFDIEILQNLPVRDPRVNFIYQEITRLHQELTARGTGMDIRYGQPFAIWQQLLKEYPIGMVYANKDYEPYARQRDKQIYQLLESHGIPFKAKKDQVIFEKNEILKKDGKPYTVYTPYSRQWKQKLEKQQLQPYLSEQVHNWHQTKTKSIISLAQMGFQPVEAQIPSRQFNLSLLKNYHKTRNLPAISGTSRLGIHLRFGTISIRKLALVALEHNQKFLNELIWRDFYAYILWHFPRVVDQNFNPKYDQINWRNNEADFQRWCAGTTGYPMVDAGMRELNQTGYMHNRVRMITASFLTKHLLIDWRWGEAYFAEKLLDYELASNNGGWQWAAGTGVDAAPYFRVFNPALQAEKFDPQMEYIKKWVPEVSTSDYPEPVIEHKFARQRALDAYKAVLASTS